MIRKIQIKYAMAFLVFLMIEVFIAMFVHDTLIRPYIGDVLVVVMLYCLIRIFVPEKHALLPLYLFLFAAGVEGLQYFELVKRLNLQSNKFFRILFGSVFDWKDIICYGIGCLVLAVWEIKQRSTL